MYTLQLIMARNSKNELWNHCFSLFVIDVMVFTAHGIPIDALGDRLSVNLTLLLTAMAFKWVLNDATPGVPYLTIMDRYVLLTFSMLFAQGVIFWFLSDAWEYRCSAEEHTGEDETYKDWWSGEERFTNKTLSGNDAGTGRFWDMTCKGIHYADRVLLSVEVFAWLGKNVWFLVCVLRRGNPFADWCGKQGQACLSCWCGKRFGESAFSDWVKKKWGHEYSKLEKEKAFVDLTYLKEYSGNHHKWVGKEEQIKFLEEGGNDGEDGDSIKQIYVKNQDSVPANAESDSLPVEMLVSIFTLVLCTVIQLVNNTFE